MCEDMQYHGKWDFMQVWNMPVGLRTHFYERLNERIERENKEMEKARRKKK